MNISLIILFLGILLILAFGFDVFITIKNKPLFKSSSHKYESNYPDNVSSMLKETLENTENISKHLTVSRENTIRILKAREQFYKNILESIGIGIIKFSENGICISANHQSGIIFEKKATLVAKNTYDVFTQLLESKISLDMIVDELQYDDATVHDLELIINNNPKWLRLTFTKTRQTSTDENSYLMCISDITSQKNKEREIHILNRKLSTIMNAMPNILLMFESDGTISERQKNNNPLNLLMESVNNIFDVFPEKFSKELIDIILKLDLYETYNDILFNMKINDIYYNYKASLTRINSGINIFLMTIDIDCCYDENGNVYTYCPKGELPLNQMEEI